MSAGRARTSLPVLAILAVAGFLVWYFALRPQQPALAPSPQERAALPGTAGPATPSPPAGSSPSPAALPGSPDGQSPAALPASPAPSTQPAAPAGGPAAAAAPSFDIVRIEPSGESVIAGRAAPGVTVELMRNGVAFARTVADASGAFAFVPPPLPPGAQEIVLEASGPDGRRVRSGQSVTVVVAERRDQKPLVTVTAPDQPTTILSQPDPPPPPAAPAPAVAASPAPSSPAVAAVAPPALPPRAAETAPPAASPAPRQQIRIATVEAEGGGRLFVSGLASPGATIRLYLNDAFVAPGAAGPDGRLSFSIERGVRPGEYRVRLDEVEAGTGAVRSRAEVGFNVPPPPPAVASAPAAPQTPSGAAAPASPAPSAASAPPPPAPSIAQAPIAPALPLADATPPRSPSAAPAASSPLPSAGQLAAVASAMPIPGSAGPRPDGAAPGPVGAATAAPRLEIGTVVVPEVNTTIVSRGDNLWRISKRVYGRGLRYTVIYDANTPQIRNPDLIYPGQIFVLPSAN